MNTDLLDRYTTAFLSKFGSSLKNPRPALQAGHNSPLILPVLWQWSINSLSFIILPQIAQAWFCFLDVKVNSIVE
jgi:hypothetical protein